MRSVEAGNLLLQDLVVDIPVGRHECLVMRAWGTSDTAQTGAITNLGRVRVNFNGRDIMSSEYEHFHAWTNGFYGLPENTSAEAGPCSFTCLIPFSNRHVPNGLVVDEDDIAQFFLTRDGVIDTTYTALSYEVLARETLAPQAYLQHFYDLTRSHSGAGPDIFELKHENIGLIAISSSVVTRMIITQDDKVRFDGAYDSLMYGADIFHEVEAASLGYVILDMAPGNDPLENLASKIGIQLQVSGAGTTTIWYTAYSFDAEKFERSVAHAVAQVARKVSEKPPARRDDIANIAQARLGISAGPKVVTPPRRIVPPRRSVKTRPYYAR